MQCSESRTEKCITCLKELAKLKTESQSVLYGEEEKKEIKKKERKKKYSDQCLRLSRSRQADFCPFSVPTGNA